ncbi:metal-independent alpha-mannosidase [Cohnella sp. CFH 77786]|nr:glycoside hydrolase family 125 protein [Cohnella sp. CFH 77786]MBW5445641.1 metal-independent alpha-mannosidase [Cohnella sp. CFH 77786]
MPAELPASVTQLIREVGLKLERRPKLARMFANCFSNTLRTTVKPMQDGTVFIITGDIPAMWLRDSAAQVRPYLVPARHDRELADLIEGVVKRQFRMIGLDPYANAFNEGPSGKGHQDDLTEMSDWIWERKYEVDSLCYPIQLAYLFWKTTGRTSHFDDSFSEAAWSILRVWRTEQRHESESAYRFERMNCPPSDTLPRGGLGSPVAETGMTWSGFRPSDDACVYGYLIPSNMFAVVALAYLREIAFEVLKDGPMAEEAEKLRGEIESGLRSHAQFDHPVFGSIYAYETDGMGRYHLMDDANIPSLLSLPYLGCVSADDAVYLNTRRFALSEHNPYFYRGKAAEGIGSPHTPDRYIWHLSLVMQALTSRDLEETERLLDTLERTDAGTELLHEGFSADDPRQYTREWFSWANSLFSELILQYCGYSVLTLAPDEKTQA